MMRQVIFSFLTALLLLGSSDALAQVQRLKPAVRRPKAITVTPVALPAEDDEAVDPVAPPESQEDEPAIGPDEAKRLKTIYEALSPEDQAEMRELYEAMEIDLLALFVEEDAAAEKRQPLLPMISRKKFARTPQAVLAARTKLGLEEEDRPDDGAPPREWAGT